MFNTNKKISGMKNSFVYLICIFLVFCSFKPGKSGELSIVGKPLAKTVLKVVFKSSKDIAEQNIVWAISDSKNGKWEELPGIHSKEIVLLTNYVGKYLKCTITSRSKSGNKTGSVSIITETPIVLNGNPNTEWFKNAGMGVMIHFLKDVYAKEGGSKEYNDVVNGFDVELFARNCKDAGAGFVMFALGQNDGYYCSPNSAYDSIVGVSPGELCSKRDLPADLYKALNKRGIRMMFYLPGNPPIRNELVDKKF